MAALEDEIEVLSQLDEYRVQSAKRRDEGRKALAASLPLDWKNDGVAADDDRPRKEHKSKRQWTDLKAPALEGALAVRALLGQIRGEDEPNVQSVVRVLTRLSTSQAFANGPDDMPILRAARTMHALVNSADATFSRIVLCFYYRLVREIYSAHPPEWVTGGTRAGEAAAATAYATGESVRAICGFIRALQRRAQYVGSILELNRKWNALNRLQQIPEAWRIIETSRLAREFYTTIETQKGNGGLATNIPLDGSSLSPFIDSVVVRMRKIVKKARDNFRQTRSEIRQFRHSEFSRNRKGSDRRRVSQTAHLIALGAVERATDTAEAILAELNQAVAHKSALDRHLTNVQRLFEEAAVQTHKLVDPAIGYLSRVLDRELAAAASDEKVNCDPPELAFAAASYGAATGRWHDERLRRATLYLTTQISERGRFPLGRPLRATLRGYKAHVIGSEVIRAVSQLLENITAVAVDPSVVKSMMMYFDDTAVIGRPGVWQHDEPVQSTNPQRWGTAFAVLALDRVNRMLDARINHNVLQHFSWRWPSESDLRLSDLFYGDYGLVTHKIVDRESIAITLERMRAHVRGFPDGANAYSLVLHGPPGTGKTTLVEALARSSEVRLVEVTPSDIVLAGVDHVERRARAVFTALSLLTRVVIMFDEFDPVLQARDTNADVPPSVFSFLTPGMLPKLKKLHEAAKKRGFVYVMLTNLIGKLDDAAIRDGRFDLRVGIYPPDLLSRIGRLYSITERRAGPRAALTVGRAEGPPLGLRGRKEARDDAIRSVIIGTGGLSMDTLGKPGWYTPPSEKNMCVEEQTPFRYIFGDPRPMYPFQTSHQPSAASQQGKTAHAIREYCEWKWVEEWDESARTLTEDGGKNATIASLLAHRPDSVKPAEREESVDFNRLAAHCRFCALLVPVLATHHGDVDRLAPHAMPPHDHAVGAVRSA
jgi:ABC-type multidrug transport system fused ATPase/permease subunit